MVSKFVVHLSIFSTYDHFRCRDRRVSASLILVSIMDTSPQTFYYSLSVELSRILYSSHHSYTEAMKTYPDVDLKSSWLANAASAKP
jgi:hypothetical protein